MAASKPSVLKPLKPSKPLKGNKEWHVPNTKKGMGDFYGSGVRNPIGKMKEGMGVKEVNKVKLKKPPKSLA